MERIGDCAPQSEPLCREFGGHDHKINTLLLMEERGFLFAGDEGGVVIQYRLRGLRESPDCIHRYTDLGIGKVCSSVFFDKVVAFGGDKNLLAVVDAERREQIVRDFKVGVKWISSLSVCPVSSPGDGARVKLAVNGQKTKNKNFQKNFLDITNSLRCCGVPVEDYKLQIEQLRSELEEVQNENTKLRAKLERQKRKRRRLRSKHKMIKEKFQGTKSKSQKIIQKLKERKMRLKKFKTDFESAEKQLEKSRENCRSLSILNELLKGLFNTDQIFKR